MRYTIYIFFWKNWKQLMFNWKTTAVLLIGCLATISLYLYATYRIYNIEEKIYDTKSIKMYEENFPGDNNDLILFSPSNNNHALEIMEYVRMNLAITSERLHSYETEAEMFSSLNKQKNTRSFAISFDEIPNALRNPRRNASNKLIYSITSTSGKIYPEYKKHFNDEDIVGLIEHDDYMQTGFAILQHAIDLSFIKMSSFGSNNVQVEIGPMPHSGLKHFGSSRMFTFGFLYTVLYYIILLTTYIIPLVEENQNGILKIIKLTTKHYRFDNITYFVIRFLLHFSFSVIASLFAFYNMAIENLKMLVMVLSLMFLFICSAMMMANCIALCFKQVFNAKIGGFIILFIPCLLYFLDSLTFLIYLLPSNTFLESFQILQTFINKHKELTFSSLFDNITEYSMKLFVIIVIFIMQIAVYCLIYTKIADNFGKCLRQLKKIIICTINNSSYPQPLTKNNYQNRNEIELTENSAIDLINVSKDFYQKRKNVREAVKNVTYSFKQNCITVLLGHNGAGKTTLINMIAGILEPTSGRILIHNEEQSYDTINPIIRLGYCMQNNIFMHYLTCKEHFQFFAQLRGMSSEEADKEVKSTLDSVKLNEKSNEYGRNLSGGMKRRLCLGIAISGNIKTVLLDEPSSGLDPASRRALWNIMLELRKRITILLTTHHMEEAEILGDNIVIMMHGKLIDSGSVIDLKKRYGVGYILKILAKNEEFDKDKIMTVIKSDISGAEIKSFVYPTFFVTLPYIERKNYAKILKDLEYYRDEYHIDTFSITDTTLDEVFLKTYDDETDTHITIPCPQTNISYGTNKVEGLLTALINDKKKITVQRIFAIMYKHHIHIYRNFFQILLMALIPMFATILTWIIISSTHSTKYTDKAIELNLNYLPKSKIYFKIHDESTFLKLNKCLPAELKKFNSEPIFLNTSKNHDINKDLNDIQHISVNLSDFYEYAIGAIELKNYHEVEMLYSNNIYHSSVIMLNFLDNFILKNFQCELGNEQKIVTYNLPYKQSQQVTEISPYRLDFYATIMPIGWFLYIMIFLKLPFSENKTGFKNLQKIPSTIYWPMSTLCDVFFHIIVCSSVYLLHLIIFQNVYNNSEMFEIMIVIFFYGLSYIPILYIFAKVFRTMTSISTILFLFFIMSTIAPIVTSINEQAMKDYEVIIFFLNFWPDFLLKNQLKIINENFFKSRRNELSSNILTNTNLPSNEELSRFSGVLYAIITFFIAEIFLILIFENINYKNRLKNFKPFNCIKFRIGQSKINGVKQTETIVNDDANYDTTDGYVIAVKQEKINVEELMKSENYGGCSLIVNNLHKTYAGQPKVVNGVHFSVKDGECFGILGLNGAGKTTMFEMITANEQITDGEIVVNGSEINIAQYNNTIGYCPQHDALNNFMTSYEILKYMALLRGIPRNEIDTTIDNILHQFNMYNYKDVRIENYSGGTKRKLNTALAVIGDLKLILLDEPTTGVDPLSRRFMWKLIQDLQNQSKTIILTSHSMDECEYLCNRLAIMGDGNFKCLDYIPKLKKMHGNGYTISLRLKKNLNSQTLIDVIKNEMQSVFPNSSIKEEHHEVIKFVIIDEPIIWDKIFHKIELIYEKYKNSVLEDYSVNEISLEDIFLNFDHQQD